MTWNYRIVAIEHEEGTQYGIHEVYYDDGIPNSYTKNPVGCVGSSIEELHVSFAHMSLAFHKPALIEEDFAHDTKNRG